MSPPAPVSRAARVLWPVAALLALAGVVALALGMAGSAGRLTGDMVGFHGGEQVEVPETGMSVWSRAPEARTEVVCTLGGSTLLRPVEDFTVEVAGERFHETARTPEDLAAGTYPLDCAASGQATEHQLYAGPYGPGTAPTGILGRNGVTLGLVLLPLALVIGLLAWLAGRRRPAAPAGSGPAASTQSEPRGASTASSPYATPAAPSGTAYPGPPPFPAGGPFTGGATPAPEAPRGPRYDLPPPS